MKTRLQRLVGALALILIISCGNDLVTEPAPEETAIADNVVIVDTLAGAHLESVSGTTYTFSLTDTLLQLVPGDIIAGTDGTGFLRQVTSTTPGDNELIVETTDASLTDAVIDGRFRWAARLPVETNPDGEGWQSFQPIAVADGISIGKDGIDLSGLELFSGSVNGTNLAIVITDGLLAFTPSVDLALEIQDQKFSDFLAIAGGPLKFTCDLTATADGPFTHSGEMHLATYEHVAVQYVESLPVVEVVTLRFDAGFEATAAGSSFVMCGIDGEYDLLFGGRSADEGWLSIWNPAVILNARPTYWESSSDMHLRVYVRPTIEIKFYGVAGPSLSASAFLDFDGDVVPAETWEWTLSGGVEGAMGLELEMIDRSLAYHAATFGSGKQTVAVDNGRVIETWEKHIGGAGSDQAEAIVATPDGGFIIAGSTDSYGAGGWDMYLVKTDARGEPMWQKTFGGTGRDLGHAVVVTTDGHYVIVGETTSFGSMARRAYLVKTDARGEVIWEKQIGIDAVIRSAIPTADGGLLAGGRGRLKLPGTDGLYLAKVDPSGTVDWENTYWEAEAALSVIQEPSGDFVAAGYSNDSRTDVWVVRVNPTGAVIWTQGYGGPSFDLGRSLALTPDGGFVVVGESRSYGGRGIKVFLVRIDDAGAALWTRAIRVGEEFDANDDGRAITVAPDGGYIIAGRTNSYGDVFGDVYIARVDESGLREWQRHYGTEGADVAEAVAVSSDGGYIVAGSTTATSGGDMDMLVIKTDARGRVARTVYEPELDL